MKVTIQFGEELTPVIQEHLASGMTVQQYVRAAVDYFNKARFQEAAGRKMGHGDAVRFSAYNTVMGTNESLMEVG
jgi:hypothetical protein